MTGDYEPSNPDPAASRAGAADAGSASTGQQPLDQPAPNLSEQPAYVQAAQGQAPYEQAAHGQVPYGEPSYGRAPYGHPSYYLAPGAPAAQYTFGGQSQEPKGTDRRSWIFGGIVGAVVAAGAVLAVGAATTGWMVHGLGTKSPAVSSAGGNNGSNNGSAGSGASGSGSTGTATDAQSTGIVYIDTVLGYQGAQAAGTGMVLSSNGEVLTNNHVVEGATEISVTVASTGKQYSAEVVGTSPTQDVAVIKLAGASGLKKAAIDKNDTVTIGDTVVGVGNAGGVSALNAATGTVIALDQSITATDDSGANADPLSGLIESSAPIQAGDSGGPLYNSDGKIIGMDTAAQTDAGTNVTSAAYSITVKAAVHVADQIESGADNATIHQGYPPFLGIEIANQAGGGFGNSGSGIAGVLVAGVIANTPAAQAGIVDGDTITAAGSTAISSASDLSSALAAYNPGDKVKVTWTAADGSSQSATVTLIQGPAD
jgi:S1-C subfamily serine protease